MICTHVAPFNLVTVLQTLQCVSHSAIRINTHSLSCQAAYLHTLSHFDHVRIINQGLRQKDSLTQALLDHLKQASEAFDSDTLKKYL